MANSYSFTTSEVDEDKRAAFQENIESSFVKTKQEKSEGSSIGDSKNIELRRFNPNTDDLEELVRKGVPYGVARNMINYRLKGGRFKRPKDLLKLYTVTDEVFSELQSMVQISSVINSQKQQTSSGQDTFSKQVVQRMELASVNMNSASEQELRKVKGIGPFYAKMIVSRREELGGYYAVNQLEEVYRLPKQVADSVSKYFYINENEIVKIPVNTCEFKHLTSHPYIKYKDAKAIMSYRQQHGRFQSLDEIRELHYFRGKQIDRILRYLDLN